MVRGEQNRRIRSVAGVLCCGLLGGCGAGGTTGFEAPRESSYSLGAISSSIGNLVAFGKLFPGEAPLPQTEGPVDCPTIEVRDGTSSVRVYSGSGQSNDAVRYGFSLGDIARECSKAGDLLNLRVGVEGRVLLGPTGSPGSYTVPVRIAVRNDSTQKIVSSQLARVSASVPAGETGAPFSYVTGSFSVPLVAHPDEDYVIMVGFDPTGRDAVEPKAGKGKKAAR